MGKRVPRWIRSLGRFDGAVYRLERTVAGIAFAGMVGVMALYVAHRVFSRPEGRLSAGVLAIARGLGMQPDPATVHGPVSLGLNLLLGFGAVWLALRTRVHRDGERDRSGAIRALLLALPIALGLAGAVWLLLIALPNGLVWGPAVALACMLWVGFLGASLATYDKKHLALEMADKIWPASWQRGVKSLAFALTAAGVALVLWLAWLSINDHYSAWLVNPLTGQLLPTEIPKWTVFTVLPWTFAVMTLRLVGEAVRVAIHVEEPPPAEDEV